MSPKKLKTDTGKFLAIMAGLWVIAFFAKLLFALIVGLVTYFVFHKGFETASFAAVLAYLLPSIIVGVIDLLPMRKRKKANKRMQAISTSAEKPDS